jgi:bacteriocin biosynthesis cyclodehydratase domain-containing protein
VVAAVSQPPDARPPGRVALLGAGPFGQYVGELLADACGGRPQPLDTPPERVFAAADAVVAALWRPAPAWCGRLDDAAHRAGVRWLPVVLEPAQIRAGPLVVPGAGPCHTCFEARRLQHDPHPAAAAALSAAYDEAPGCGPAGHLPQQARAAAALAAVLLAAPDAEAGTVLRVASGAHAVRRDSVTGRNGCPRCGADRPRRDLDAVLRHAMKEAVGAC